MLSNLGSYLCSLYYVCFRHVLPQDWDKQTENGES